MAATPGDNERGILPGALLVGAVLAILGAGVVLSTGPPGRSAAVPARAPLPPPPSPELDAAEPEISPVDLSDRVAEDVRRLGQAEGPYTAQILVACKIETIERLVAGSGGASSLYVLPADVRGQSCYRVCWGSYMTSEDAALASDLPAALRSGERPRPVQIVSVLP